MKNKNLIAFLLLSISMMSATAQECLSSPLIEMRMGFYFAEGD